MAVVFALLVPGGLSAQNGTAALAGIVTDSLRRPIAEAEVRVSGMARAVRTDSAGRFLVTALSAGIFQVAVRRIGFAPAEVTVRLTSDDTTQTTFVLHASSQ